MASSRRRFLTESGLLVAADLVGCRAPVAPAIVTISQRSVRQLLPGMPTSDDRIYQ